MVETRLIVREVCDLFSILEAVKVSEDLAKRDRAHNFVHLSVLFRGVKAEIWEPIWQIIAATLYLEQTCETTFAMDLVKVIFHDLLDLAIVEQFSFLNNSYSCAQVLSFIKPVCGYEHRCSTDLDQI